MGFLTLGAELVGVNTVKIANNGATVQAILPPNARQTFVPSAVPPGANGFAAKVGANVPAILASNARQTHVTRG